VIEDALAGKYRAGIPLRTLHFTVWHLPGSAAGMREKAYTAGTISSMESGLRGGPCGTSLEARSVPGAAASTGIIVKMPMPAAFQRALSS